jgi:hypothetical protein
MYIGFSRKGVLMNSKDSKDSAPEDEVKLTGTGRLPLNLNDAGDEGCVVYHPELIYIDNEGDGCVTYYRRY